MEKNEFTKMMQRLSPLKGFELFEFNPDFYYELVEDMDAEDFRKMLKEILLNEDYFPSLKKFYQYVKKANMVEVFEYHYLLTCKNCNRSFVANSSYDIRQIENYQAKCICGGDYSIQFLSNNVKFIPKQNKGEQK